MKSLNDYVNESKSKELSLNVTIACSDRYTPSSDNLKEGAQEYYQKKAKDLLKELEKFGDILSAEISDGHDTVDVQQLH